MSRSKTLAVGFASLLCGLIVGCATTAQRPNNDRELRDLALMQIERNKLGDAVALLNSITDPRIVISIEADARFDAVRPRLTLPDAATAAQKAVAAARAAAAHSPHELEPFNRLLNALRTAGQFDEMLKLCDATMARVQSEGRTAFSDLGTYNWILDKRADALLWLGRSDEAIAQLLAASYLPERSRDNISQVINLAGLYNDLQRPREALQTLQRLGPGISPYGGMQVLNEVLKGALQLGDSARANRAAQYLSDHRKDAMVTYEAALVRMNKLDEAAELLISRLREPSQRIAALINIQNYQILLTTPLVNEDTQRWRSIVQRADVLAVIQQVGYVHSYPLTPPQP